MGFGILLILVSVSIYVLFTFPIDFGEAMWSNPTIWADNPKAAPPAWINLFGEYKRAEHIAIEERVPSRIERSGGSITHIYEFEIDYRYDELPSFVSISFKGIEYHRLPPLIYVSVTRPDGREIELLRSAIAGPESKGERIVRFVDAPLRIRLSGEESVRRSIESFFMDKFGFRPGRELVARGLDRLIFSEVRGGGIEVLKGEYRFSIGIVFTDEGDRVDLVRLVIAGSVYGIMGTDDQGRDIASGLAFGFPVALFIGFVTSLITTAIGSMLGIFSGYMGGRADTAIQRASDILANLPLLPLLIFLAFVFEAKLWLIILILVAFGWPGLTIVVRSMVLQLRSGQLIEASRALGASRLRIMVRHIFPQLAPYIFAQMIFFTPGAILAEAALSFLGLGDPTIPTWGQILEKGFRTGAVYVGYWWWILPPGLLIMLSATAFVFIALALEPIVNPRLRHVA